APERLARGPPGFADQVSTSPRPARGRPAKSAWLVTLRLADRPPSFHKSHHAVKKILIIVLFLGVSVGLIWLVWFRPAKTPEEEKKPEAEVPVHVAKITRANLRSYVTAYGMVEPDPKAGARVAVSVPGVVK